MVQNLNNKRKIANIVLLETQFEAGLLVSILLKIESELWTI